VIESHVRWDEEFQAAVDELTERWRAEAETGAPAPWAAAASRFAASLEAGAVHLSEVRAAQAAIGAQRHAARGPWPRSAGPGPPHSTDPQPRSAPRPPGCAGRRADLPGAAGRAGAGCPAPGV